jgi:ribosomal protein L11 methyltransferase
VVVRPAWVDPVPLGPDDVEVLVDPGGAFGSGSHPTTRLCLAAVERLVAGGEAVLDVGCGSGVLGVAAALLGAGAVGAIDVDPEAVRATVEVAGLNDVADSVVASTTALAEVSGRFDLVVANLLIPIIEELGPDLVVRCAPGATLVLSGLLPEHRARAVVAVAPLRVVAEHELEGWTAIELVRDWTGPRAAAGGLRHGAVPAR